jgi:hypothetical protein
MTAADLSVDQAKRAEVYNAIQSVFSTYDSHHPDARTPTGENASNGYAVGPSEVAGEAVERGGDGR